MSKKAENPYGIYIDDDGYLCFTDCEDMGGEGVWWTLHYGGWEAFLPDTDDPCYSTDEVTFPTDDEMGEVAQIYQEYLNKQGG